MSEGPGVPEEPAFIPREFAAPELADLCAYGRRVMPN